MANDSSTSSTATREVKPTAPMTWMQRLRRVFEIDLRFCPRCGAQLRVLAATTNPRVINAILTHCDARDDGAPGATRITVALGALMPTPGYTTVAMTSAPPLSLLVPALPL